MIQDLCTRPDGKSGFVAKVYNEAPDSSDRTLMDEIPLKSSYAFFADYVNPKLHEVFYMDVLAEFTPIESGEHEFGVAVAGTAKLFLDGKLVLDNATKQISGDSFFGSGTREERSKVMLEAGRKYALKVEFGSGPTTKLHASGTGVGAGGFRIGAAKILDPQEEIEKAVKLAKEVDQVVICAGLSVSTPQCVELCTMTYTTILIVCSPNGSLKVTTVPVWVSRARVTS